MVQQRERRNLSRVTLLLLVTLGVASRVHSADQANPALWNATVGGDYARILAGVKAVSRQRNSGFWVRTTSRGAWRTTWRPSGRTNGAGSVSLT